jgi:hypothetical protein
LLNMPTWPVFKYHIVHGHNMCKYVLPMISMMDTCSVFIPSATPAAIWAWACARAGSPKASVLPEPVAAIPMTSSPEQAGAQHSLCIGLGVAKLEQDCKSFGLNPVKRQCAHRLSVTGSMRCRSRTVHRGRSFFLPWRSILD